MSCILRFFFLSLFLILPTFLKAEWGLGGYQSDLMSDLMIVECINQRLSERYPVYYNNLLYGGYINMPSARMGLEGEIGAGYSSVYPYRNYNLRFQFLDRLEISGNYRIFSGIDDPILSISGFGDKSDKGANVKFAIMHPEDTNFTLPGIAVGFDDFMGTKGFEARYVVLTQVIPKWNLECSLGIGQKRYRRWFGGFTWVPFRCHGNYYLENLALVAEYDAIPYKSERREPHPDGRTTKSPINYGIKYRLWNLLDFTASYIKGEKFSYAVSTYYNFGTTNGFLPKIGDPLPYTSPRITQPLGPLRPNDVLVQDLYYPFLDQGFELQKVWLSCDYCGNKILRLNVCNFSYRYEDEVRDCFNNLLANLIPSDISEVIIVLENGPLPIQEYRFPMEYVRMYGEKEICPYEMYLLSPACEASKPVCSRSQLLFKNQRDLWNLELYPKTYSAFGSAKGKFKYLLGIHLGINGLLWCDWYYNILLGYTFVSSLYDVNDVDRLNPSQIINVRTDSVNYFKESRFTVDEAYLQKWCNLGRGWYGTLAFGLFEAAYGGVASEFLYYPVNSNWAFGIEGAYLRKREYSGVGFTDKIRKLDGFRKTYQKFRGSQYFANLYYNFDYLDLDIRVKAGKFLAKDWGARTELSRYYPSGMRFYMWYTYTDAKDFVNGNRYHDHGVGITLPLDMFYTYSSREWWGYGMSAWLRDVGAFSCTGIPLYYQIRDNRECAITPFKRGIW